MTVGYVSLLLLLFFQFVQSTGAVEYTPTAYLQRGKTPPNKYPGYGTKQSDGEVTVMLEL